MSREDVLLKEYEICQQVVRDHSSRYWTILGVFMPVSTALLGALVAAVISSGVSLSENPVGCGLSLATGFGAGMAAMLWFLYRWLSRITHYLKVTYFRMREIEACLGMLEHSTIDWIDHRKQAPESQQVRLDSIQRNRRIPPMEIPNLLAIFTILILLWILLALGSLILLYDSSCLAGSVTLGVLVVSAAIISLIYIYKVKEGRDRAQ